MYEVKKANTKEEKLLIAPAMKEFWDIDADHMWGVWDGNKCIGGTSVYNCHEFMPRNNFSMRLDIKPSYGHWVIGYRMIVEALKVTNKLVAKIEVTNLLSRKGAKQLGFKHIYTEDGCEYLELQKVPEKLHKRWQKYVQSNS
jgi:hypothetical protein